MAWSYIKLWKLLLDKGMKRIDLAAAANLTSNTLAKLGKDKEVSMETLNKICNSSIAELKTFSNTFLTKKQTEVEPRNSAISRLRSIFLGTMFFEIFKVY